ncbi:hypothetical protein OCT63_17095 [Vibrio sp. RW]|uniref:hypothetical protein n=1 Tax=Vibrio sp. RW TaxID=2998833 RepID=UPI0022CD332A|nr:hypothetical protein [Vibrio sp. RW]MDA0145944.1 hypothetical protein [Vibrio sp. RW]
MLSPLQIPNARTSRRALYARTSLDDANGVQSLAPTKDTVVTGFAELPIGKESISSRLFVHQRISSANGEAHCHRKLQSCWWP